MEAVWIAVALVVAVVGGWPVTAGLLKFAKSKAVRAVDAAEAGPAETSDAAEAGPAEASGPEGAASGVGAMDAGANGTGAHQEQEPPETPETRSGGASAVEDSGTLPAAPPDPKTEVLRGGLLIGFLERAAVTVAILAGQPVAIAYVVAIKGLGRYPELKDTPAASERFIIGTLASMLWAASVATLAKALLL